MHFDWIKIIALAMPIITIIINQIIERRPHLVSYLGHLSFFPVKEANSFLSTHSIILKNTGRKSAINVRVGHYNLPDNYVVVPPTKFTIEPLSNDGREIVFPIIVPKEEITISYLYSNPVTFDNVKPIYLKSDEGFAKILNAIPTPQPQKWVVRLAQFLMLAGISISVYFILKVSLVIYNMSITPPS
jgi:hypothetical protein